MEITLKTKFRKNFSFNSTEKAKNYFNNAIPQFSN